MVFFRNRMHLYLCLVCFLISCAPNDSDVETPSSESNLSKGIVELKILDFGQIEQLVASHRGKVVVMDAWSTSCGPCVREFPNLVALSHRYSRDRLACISLSFDYQGIGTVDEVASKVLGFLQQQGADFDNVLSSELDEDLYQKFDLGAVPAVFVYDQEGKLQKRFDNESGEEFSYEDVERLVAELLSATPRN